MQSAGAETLLERLRQEAAATLVTLPLDGVTVVVTRPAAQASRFLELARAAGAACIPYPTLQIDRIALDDATRAQLQSRSWDWAIFTSANAVESALEQCPTPLAARHAAVGRATARALEQHGIKVDACPESASSEGLLELAGVCSAGGPRRAAGQGQWRPRAAARCPARTGRRRARTRGVPSFGHRTDRGGGGAAARRADQHGSAGRRSDQRRSPAILARARRRATTHARLRSRTLLVPGPRVAAAGARLGWTGPVVAAATAEDEAMLAALTGLAAGSKPPA